MIPFNKNYLSTSGTGFNWKCEIHPVSRPVKSYYEETVLAAEKIWAQKQGPLYLMYSGGVDSEFLLNVFLQLKMDVCPVIIKLNDYNDHDTGYAFKFCDSKNITPLIINLDFDKFVDSGEIVDIAEQAGCAHWMLPSTYKAVAQLDGTVVMGSHGPPHLILNQGVTSNWVIREDEALHSVVKWFKHKNIHGTPFMLVNTPEQYLAWLQDPTTIDLVNFKFPGKLGNTSTKGLVYNNNPDFKLEARPKFTGFENIVSSEIFKHPTMHTMLRKVLPPTSEGNGYYIEEYHAMTKRLKG